MATRTIGASRLLAELAYGAEEPTIPGLPSLIRAEDIKDFDLSVLYKRLTFALEDYMRMRSALQTMAQMVVKREDEQRAKRDGNESEDNRASGKDL